MRTPLSPATLSALLAPSAAPVTDDASAWWCLFRPLALAHPDPFARAVVGGALADRPGWAFCAGYHAALSALVPSLPSDHRAALCATEDRGGHPRAIETSLSPAADGGLLLHGTKRFVSLGTLADTLLVVAREGARDGRPALRLARVSLPAAGVSLDPQPALPFAPEVPHASLALDGVALSADAVLDGDGYDRYLKPFRTVEDLYVTAAMTAHLLATSRRYAWDPPWATTLFALLESLGDLSVEPASDPRTHLRLDGLLALLRHTLDASLSQWERCPPPVAARFARDRPLLSVASRVREARTAAAWTALTAPSAR